jgi:hypothetical protein
MAHDPTPNDDALPGETSNQNAEEQPSDDEQATGGRSPARGRGDEPSGGEPSEGSQSTGSPTSAG